MPAISGRKKWRQFGVRRYASNFGSENMPAVSGRKKKMPAMSDRTKCQQIRAGINSGKFRPEKKMPVFSGGYKIAGKPAIAGELTGL